ncbi:hypothetical protein QTQ03_21120 [Micromonospora sp. WMMA1363]|uniref:FtsX-like permease family protein n=1 Tax=Micromonospora sp. WMMA1363 TaxID=3053985 RepID=UPI00259CF84C|nr:FtsX-like permease family protein [Micromonospora sp. WMMA1363]MDM4721970.1 hypothetical protein [Micromonospora sp. WMMA1363]
MRDLIFGARLAFTGGRDGWTRTMLTALGVGIGVALLLLAAAVPGALQARQARGDARSADGMGELPAAANTLLAWQFTTEFRGTPVRGALLRAEGPQAPPPPGVAALPGPGEVVVSPALRDLLASPDGRLFAPRLGGAQIVGTIGKQGLVGPRELTFYRGSDALTSHNAVRIDRFGSPPTGTQEPWDGSLRLLVVIMVVVLLLPIAVFLGAAVRFGGERRDRRLAALRLVGADKRMICRIAAGEATAAALLGLAVGGVLFALGRQLVPLVTLWDISVYADDVRPSLPLLAVIVVAAPAVAVVVGLIALRGIVIEPLGVTRRATTTRRRLWWRLLLPAVGLALIYPLVGGRDDATGTDYQVAAGSILLLMGTVTLLPWLVDLLVRRVRGGPVAWQLAIRRLQLDSATSARLVNGIAVAVAGTIGLQMLFAAAEGEHVEPTGHDLSRAQAVVQISAVADAPAALARLEATEGIANSIGSLRLFAPSTAPTHTPRSASATVPGWPSSRGSGRARTATCSWPRGRRTSPRSTPSPRGHG